jgi:colanic acid biosynthesis protein WcaH
MPISALLNASGPAASGQRSVPVAPLLDTASFVTLVANAPLVSIDLIVEDQSGAVLLGMRTNRPARGCWFVPGGRIRKNETLDAAFSRITSEELGLSLTRSKARLLDVYEHFYDTDFAGTPQASTHYVVLAYRLRVIRESLSLPDGQHSSYAWMRPAEAALHPVVHPNSQAYFTNQYKTKR